MGREARVFTDLKPAGKVEIDGKIYEAVDVGYIPKAPRSASSAPNGEALLRSVTKLVYLVLKHFDEIATDN